MSRKPLACNCGRRSTNTLAAVDEVPRVYQDLLLLSIPLRADGLLDAAEEGHSNCKQPAAAISKYYHWGSGVPLEK